VVGDDDSGETVYANKTILVQGLAEMRSGATTSNRYMQVLHTFGPAMLGVLAWAELGKSQAICDVMTVTDDAIIHLVVKNFKHAGL
jgi:hypothetical protein